MNENIEVELNTVDDFEIEISDFIKVEVPNEYILPIANNNVLGGVKGNVKGVGDTVSVKIDDNGFMHVPTYPAKTSQLTNDSEYITNEDLPTKTSDLQNDSGYITNESLPTNTSELINDSDYITSESLPTKTSQLTNDSNFINTIPSEYITEDELTTELNNKQDNLVSGNNIKTVNGTTLLGSGNISIPKGDKGDTGARGLQGIQGETGEQGEQGEQGIQGIQGDTGAKGEQGIQGEKGEQGDVSLTQLNVVKDDLAEHKLDYANPHGVTKTQVSLDNVDNLKQMPISNGVLENYREKLNATTSVINLSLGNVFTDTPNADRTYSITNAIIGQAHSFTLYITMGATIRTLTFPASVKWVGGEIPDMTMVSKTYVLVFSTINGGTTWFGNGSDY